jgi:RNA recognition motif-containing protein
MSDNESERSGRRRRGGRRRSKNREDRVETRSAPQKQTLWEKIISFFRPKQKTTQTQQPARKYPAYEPRSQSAGTAERTERPERSERSERSERPERSERSERSERRESSYPRESRKPESVEVTSPKLYVGNLSFDASESDLSNLFNGVGQVQNAEIVSHKETDKSKGFGFVTMTTVDEAVRAVSELHDKEFMGRKLVVSGAKTPAR